MGVSDLYVEVSRLQCALNAFQEIAARGKLGFHFTAAAESNEEFHCCLASVKAES
jgi:hypothetical protein